MFLWESLGNIEHREGEIIGLIGPIGLIGRNWGRPDLAARGSGRLGELRKGWRVLNWVVTSFLTAPSYVTPACGVFCPSGCKSTARKAGGRVEEPVEKKN